MQITGGFAMGLATAGSVPPERTWLKNSLLDQTRLFRFIWYSFIIHLVAMLLHWLVPVKPAVPTPPPPIRVKIAEPAKPKSELEKGTIIDAPKPKKIEKPRSSKLLASHDARAHSNLKKSEDKTYRRKKTVVPKPSGAPQVAKRSVQPPRKKAPKPVAQQKAQESKQSFPVSDRGTFVPQAKGKQQTETQSNLSSGTKGTLSLLDGFDPDKYAALDTKTLDESYDDEDVSLDTTETEYASYFARIKHQIERVWMYPSEAAQRGISGKLTLRFRISRDGNLVSAGVVDKSGHEILDFAAIKAVKEAAPFYPFPVNIKKDKLSILATFIYSPNYGLLKK
jgi:protein TonB